jgi:hypothetical protein
MHRYATALRSNDLSRRREAVRDLCALGCNIPLTAIDSLLNLLRDPDETVRDGVADALIQVARADGPARERAVSGLGDLLVHPEELSRLRAVGIVNRIGPPAAPLIPLLVVALKGPNRILCRVAAEALCRIGSAAIPALEAAQSEPVCRAAAKWALGKIGQSADEGADTVIQSKQSTAPAIALATSAPAATRAHHGRERRTTPRYPCSREVFYQLMTRKGQDLWWDARILDVSLGGVALTLTRSVSMGDRIAVDLREAHQGVERNAVARVVHVGEVRGGWKVGCAWLGPLTPEELALLRAPE